MVVHKTGKLLGNKIADAVTSSYDDKNCENKTCWRSNYSSRKKKINIKPIEISIIKMELYKISKSLNDSTVMKFVTKNGLK